MLVNGAQAPVFPAQLTLSRDQPLELSWTGGTHKLGFVLGQPNGFGVHLIQCDTTSDAQSFTIPAVVMAELTADPGSLQFVHTSIKTVAAGEASVSLGLATHPNPGVVMFTVE